MTWASLSPPAKVWRVAHASWSVAQLASLGYVWSCVLRRRRTPALWAGVAFLLAEGAGLLAGRGNCPMGARQEEWGDPVPFFELVLPARAAKVAVPALGAISIAGIVGLAVRRPGLVIRGLAR